MRTLVAGILAVLLVAAITTRVALSQEGGIQRQQVVTKADVERWKKELSNWGRWGKDDQMGALNLITPAKRKQAAALVKEGVSVSLSRREDTPKAEDNPYPYERTLMSYTNDTLALRFHGYAHTHLDSLAHGFLEGVGYNGYSPNSDAIMAAGGHATHSVYNVRNGIFTRGILMDIPRLKGVPYLEPGTRIYPEDLEAWEKKAGIKVSAGDALFIRTGRWVRRAKLGPWDTSKSMAGLDVSCIPWLKQRDVALLSGEAPQDATPQGGDVPNLIVHGFTLSYLGMQLIDNSDLDAVSETAAAMKRWEFLLTFAPLALPGGTGSPVNPIATF